MPRFHNPSAEELEKIRRFVEETDIEAIDDETRKLVEKHWPWLLGKLPPHPGHVASFSHEESAKRLYGLGEMEQEALDVLRLIVGQTERGESRRWRAGAKKERFASASCRREISV